METVREIHQVIGRLFGDELTVYAEPIHTPDLREHDIIKLEGDNVARVYNDGTRLRLWNETLRWNAAIGKAGVN